MAGYALDELAQYGRTRNPIPGVDVTELGVERRGAIRSPGVNRSAIPGLDVVEGMPPRNNPNVGPAGSAEAQAFRSSGAGAVRALPAAGEAAAANATRLGAIRTAGGVAARALAPTNPIGLALTAATAVPAMAQAGRERGAGRALSDQNAGNPAAGDLRPGQLGAIRANALGDARAQALRAAYDNPEVAAQNAGAYNSLVQRAANQGATAATPLAPSAAGAGRGFVNPDQAQPGATPAGTGGGRGTVNPNAADPGAPPPEVDQPLGGPGPYAPRTQQSNQPSVPPIGSRPVDIEQRALAIERENSGLRQQIDGASEPGARNADGTGGAASLSSGYSADLARKNAETTADSLRNDAKLASGQRQRELLDQAAAAEAAPRAEQLARAGLDNQLQLGAIRERGDLAQRQLAEATARRGQDLEAAGGRERTAGALAVEGVRGKSALDVAREGADARVAAAEARANQTKYQVVNLPDTETANGVVLKGGQLLVSDGTIVRPQDQQSPAAPPAGAIAKLKSDPKLAADFDAKYGKGAAAAALAAK